MINKVILIGNVGQEPEIKTTSAGIKVAKISLATTEKTYNSETRESKEHTEWHSIVLWRGLAEIVEKWVSKGSQVYIEGKIRSQEWTDNNGVKRSRTTIVADTLKLLGRRESGNAAPAPQSLQYSQPAAAHSQTDTPQPANEGYDDLPF